LPLCVGHRIDENLFAANKRIVQQKNQGPVFQRSLLLLESAAETINNTLQKAPAKITTFDLRKIARNGGVKTVSSHC